MMHSIVLTGSFQFKLEVSKVEREMLLSLPNAIYEAVLNITVYKTEINKLMCTKTPIGVYENLWRLDVLGVIDTVRDDIAIHQDFKDQLKRSKEGQNETRLMWKAKTSLNDCVNTDHMLQNFLQSILFRTIFKATALHCDLPKAFFRYESRNDFETP